MSGEHYVPWYNYNIHPTKRTILTIAIALAVMARVLFAFYQPRPLINADSLGYFTLGVQMVKQPTLSNLISEFRTPLYPVFIVSLAKLSGFNGEYIFGPFDQAGNTIMVVQHVLGIIGVVLLFFLLVLMGLSNRNILVFSVLSAMNIFIFYWERSILTEGLATITLLLSLLLFAHTLRTPNTKNFLFLCISYTVNFILRPVFIFLPLVTLPFLFMTVKKRTEKIKVILTFIASCLIPVLYMAGNSVYHNYRGIQHINDIDMLGRILEFHTPIDAGKTYSFFFDTVTDYRNRKAEPNPFQFINSYDIDMYGNTSRLNDLQAFTRTIVLHNFPSYVTHALSGIPAAMTDVSPPIISMVDKPLSPLQLFFSVLLTFYRILLPITLLAIPCYPIALYLFFQKKSTKRILLAAMGSVAVSCIVLTVLVVYKEDYGRLFSPIQPLFLVFIVGTLQELFQPKTV